MQYAYLRFFNIEDLYCSVYSLFGGKCTEAAVATSTFPAGTNAPSVGFWGWLLGNNTFLGSIVGVIAAILGFIWTVFSILTYTLSALLLILILASLVGLVLIRLRERDLYADLPPQAAKGHPLQGRWQALLDRAMSSDPLHWKEAILGADALMGELFARLGYAGATTAERIQRVPEGAFANLSSAWEAHRIRNFVSAPSSHFILTQREAFRVMKLYEQVFREFDFI